MTTMKPVKRVAVVGAGVSGMVCSYALRASGVDVHVFDMGARGPGGRASTRKQAGFQFDHGCSFVAPPADDRLKALTTTLTSAGVLKAWDARVGSFDGATLTSLKAGSQAAQGTGFCNALRPGPLLCGHPSMDAVCRYLAESSGVKTSWNCRVSSLLWDLEDQIWKVAGHHGGSKDAGGAGALADLGSFDAVVLADRSPFKTGSAGAIDMQAAGLEGMAETCTRVKNAPCFALMLAFPKTLGIPYEAVSVDGDDTVMWMSCDSSKPGRERDDGKECWVVLSTHDYAQGIIDQKPLTVDGKYNPQTKAYLDGIAPSMQANALSLLQKIQSKASGSAGSVPEPEFVALQRWGAGFVANPLGEPLVQLRERRVVACGDFCLGSTFENAYVSGIAAADEVLSWSKL